MKDLKLCIILTAAAFFISACGQTASPTEQANIAANSPASVQPSKTQSTIANDPTADAKELYAMNCMACHRDSGKGGKVTVGGKNLKPADLTLAKVKARTDDKLISDVRDGLEDDGMPAFKDKLTPDQIKSIVKYIRTLE